MLCPVRLAFILGGTHRLKIATLIYAGDGAAALDYVDCKRVPAASDAVPDDITSFEISACGNSVRVTNNDYKHTRDIFDAYNGDRQPPEYKFEPLMNTSIDRIRDRVLSGPLGIQFALGYWSPSIYHETPEGVALVQSGTSNVMAQNCLISNTFATCRYFHQPLRK
jgi:hypothetical protein